MNVSFNDVWLGSGEGTLDLEGAKNDQDKKGERSSCKCHMCPMHQLARKPNDVRHDGLSMRYTAGRRERVTLPFTRSNSGALQTKAASLRAAVEIGLLPVELVRRLRPACLQATITMTAKTHATRLMNLRPQIYARNK